MLRLSAALTLCVGLAGCAPAYGPGPGTYDYGPYPAEAISFDGFYDGYYGPFFGGYWARDGYFYYADRDRHFHRDFHGHFRHDNVPGYHPFHGAPHGGGHSAGGPHR
jgi:hypothetical protein